MWTGFFLLRLGPVFQIGNASLELVHIRSSGVGFFIGLLRRAQGIVADGSGVTASSIGFVGARTRRTGMLIRGVSCVLGIDHRLDAGATAQTHAKCDRDPRQFSCHAFHLPLSSRINGLSSRFWRGAAETKLSRKPAGHK